VPEEGAEIMTLKNLPSDKSLQEMAARHPTLDISATVAYLNLLRMSSMLQYSSNQKLSKFGISRGRCNILILLSMSDEPLPVSKIANMTGVSTPTITDVISGMVRDGLIQRVGDTKDRRVVRIGLKQAGMKVLNNVLPVIFTHHKVVMNEIEREKLEVLNDILAEIKI
jgi:DNA-binding MarR family transcriptional regulator